jgi:hypothetical protein
LAWKFWKYNLNIFKNIYCYYTSNMHEHFSSKVNSSNRALSSSRVKVLWLRTSIQYLDECGYLNFGLQALHVEPMKMRLSF